MLIKTFKILKLSLKLYTIFTYKSSEKPKSDVSPNVIDLVELYEKLPIFFYPAHNS